MAKAVVGMSGGVDSAVTAYLLKLAGYEVIGVTLRTWHDENRCCKISDAADIADQLGIAYYAVSCLTEFQEQVVTPFIESYLIGQTPNPCIRCNPAIKWEKLTEFADMQHAEYVATGHYAEIVQMENGRYSVRQAAHSAKDQTYMLCRLTQEQLSRTLLPLGRLSKAEVRQIAADVGLAVAQKPDSQEICFVTDGNYADFIAEHSVQSLPPPGDFTDMDGNAVGRHQGIYRYTVGQRKGLGIALGAPAYVRQIDAGTNTVVLGDGQSLLTKRVLCNEVSFMGLAGMNPGEPVRARAKIRYHHPAQPVAASLSAEGDLCLAFDAPVRAPAPGQTAVLYDEEGRVLAAGTIRSGYES